MFLGKLLNVFGKTSKCFFKDFQTFLWAIRHFLRGVNGSKETAIVSEHVGIRDVYMLFMRSMSRLRLCSAILVPAKYPKGEGRVGASTDFLYYNSWTSGA